MRSTLSSLSSDKGFTLVELMVASLLGVVVVGMLLGAMTANREYFKNDIVRARVNENVRGTLDIIAADLRLGGENLGSAFPAIEVTTGATSNDEKLFIRRAVIPEVLPLCTALAANSTSPLYFATGGTTAGCTYSGQTSNYNAWRTYRLSQGGSVRAYIYDSSAKAGEFFDYTSETNSGTQYSLTRSGRWSRAYPTGSTAVYILEEWQFRVEDGNLVLVENEESSELKTVAFNVTGFDIDITAGGVATETFAKTDAWTTITVLRGRLTVQEMFLGQPVSRTVQASFFPRNILSN